MNNVDSASDLHIERETHEHTVAYESPENIICHNLKFYDSIKDWQLYKVILV